MSSAGVDMHYVEPAGGDESSQTGEGDRVERVPEGEGVMAPSPFGRHTFHCRPASAGDRVADAAGGQLPDQRGELLFAPSPGSGRVDVENVH